MRGNSTAKPEPELLAAEERKAARALAAEQEAKARSEAAEEDKKAAKTQSSEEAKRAKEEVKKLGMDAPSSRPSGKRLSLVAAAIAIGCLAPH